MRIREIIAGTVALIAVAGIAPAVAGAVASHSETITPLLMNVADAPVPFGGSDGRQHLVYELGMTNFSPARPG